MTNTLDKLIEISSRIEHLQNSADWITRETANTDSGISQTATLIAVLAENIQEMVCEVCKEVEHLSELQKLN